MSDPVEKFSQGNNDELSPNNSARRSVRSTDTSTYFETWLEFILPQLSAEVSSGSVEGSVPARSADAEPVPGEFRFEGTLRVDCYVTGLMRSQTGTLVVSETGEVDTDLFVPAAIIDGVVRGDIRATEQVELGRNARVIGNIETPSLAIQPGAVFEGTCHFVPALNKVCQPAPIAAEVARLSVVRSRAVTSEPLESEAAEELVAAAGR
ncbi:MAG: polymer-forming cytoskeletal protein [Acidobacteriota bacterium]